MRRARFFGGTTVVFICLPLFLGSCAGRPGPEVLETVAVSGQAGKSVTVYSATTRARSLSQKNAFGNDRTRQTNFASFTVSLPKGHKSGEIDWPKGKPDPEVSFAVTKQQVLNAKQFEQEVSVRSSQKALVFVHGYNYNYQEALYRLVQISADAEGNRIPILFSWPSAASISGYVADKDSATFSRDNLASLLITMSQGRSEGDVIVFSHSMGAWLTMEALRQLRLQNRTDVLSKLVVVLAAPDIDADVFDVQAGSIKGSMARPLTVLISKDDRALKVSSLISTGQKRVGALDVRSPLIQESARKNDVLFLDISEIETTDRMKHDRFVSLAALGPKLDFDGGDTNKLRHAGAFVMNGIGDTIAAPFRLVSASVQQ